jgi:hypothetical protein
MLNKSEVIKAVEKQKQPKREKQLMEWQLLPHFSKIILTQGGQL